MSVGSRHFFWTSRSGSYIHTLANIHWQTADSTENCNFRTISQSSKHHFACQLAASDLACFRAIRDHLVRIQHLVLPTGATQWRSVAGRPTLAHKGCLPCKVRPSHQAKPTGGIPAAPPDPVPCRHAAYFLDFGISCAAALRSAHSAQKLEPGNSIGREKRHVSKWRSSSFCTCHWQRAAIPPPA